MADAMNILRNLHADLATLKHERIMFTGILTVLQANPHSPPLLVQSVTQHINNLSAQIAWIQHQIQYWVY